MDGIDITHIGKSSTIDRYREKIVFEYAVPKIKKIEIELVNKEPTDTLVVDNKITEDLLLIIDSIKIDSIDLTDKLDKISVYRGAGQVYRSHGYITFRGTMTIKIHDNLLYTDWLSGLL